MDEIFLTKVRPARHSPAAVIGFALKVGLVAAVPVGLLIVLGPAFAQALVGGASLGQAWEATAPTGDDWEVLPAFLVGVVLLSVVVSLASAAAWLLVRRSQGSARLAHAGAVVAAAGVPLLLLGLVNCGLAVSLAVPAGLVALVAPLVGRAPGPPRRAATT